MMVSGPESKAFAGARAEGRWLWATDFGRTSVWDVVHEGAVVARMDHVKWSDMFWHDYRVVAVEGCQDVVRDAGNWEQGRFRFRNRDTGWFCEGAFAGGEIGAYCAGRTSEVSMRALYFVPRSNRVRCWIRWYSFVDTCARLVGRRKG